MESMESLQMWSWSLNVWFYPSKFMDVGGGGAQAVEDAWNGNDLLQKHRFWKHQHKNQYRWPENRENKRGPQGLSNHLGLSWTPPKTEGPCRRGSACRLGQTWAHWNHPGGTFACPRHPFYRSPELKWPMFKIFWLGPAYFHLLRDASGKWKLNIRKFFK